MLTYLLVLNSPHKIYYVVKVSLFKSNYKKELPDGTNVYVEIDTEEIPKGVTTLLQTGGASSDFYYVVGLILIAVAGFSVRRKDDLR